MICTHWCHRVFIPGAPWGSPQTRQNSERQQDSARKFHRNQESRRLPRPGHSPRLGPRGRGAQEDEEAWSRFLLTLPSRRHPTLRRRIAGYALACLKVIASSELDPGGMWYRY